MMGPPVPETRWPMFSRHVIDLPFSVIVLFPFLRVGHVPTAVGSCVGFCPPGGRPPVPPPPLPPAPLVPPVPPAGDVGPQFKARRPAKTPASCHAVLRMPPFCRLTRSESK